ncbi:MAG: hypothetical protein DDT42_02136 [candidate division WS2 bacterium]|uniref:Uncharacterized protein n=1 Tax=Psychracetigena formicireducens TaxID=2986056 RepID=A0A9E2BIZ0_PSYF1|nr:hypothetical protein [Candidatus Psychracetigena formicireducens]
MIMGTRKAVKNTINKLMPSAPSEKSIPKYLIQGTEKECCTTALASKLFQIKSTVMSSPTAAESATKRAILPGNKAKAKAAIAGMSISSNDSIFIDVKRVASGIFCC